MTTNKLNSGFRMSPELHAGLVEIAAELSRKVGGVSIGLPTAIRLCVERGIPVMRAELGLVPPVHPSVAPKGKS